MISKMKKKQLISNAIFLIIGIGVTCLFLFPLYWMITTSIREPGSTFTNPSFFPESVQFSAYVMQTENGVSIWSYFMNSVVVSLGTTILTIILAIPAAYAIGRFNLKIVSPIIFVFLVAQMMPSSLILTPIFVTFSNLGLINNHIGVMLADATITIPFSVIILRTYFKDIPKELEEAALIDGAGPYTTFLKIMIPVTFPGIITAISMSLIMSWGDMVFSLTLLTRDRLRTLPLILYKAMGELGVRWEILMAYATIVIIPIIIMFVFLQRFLISGLTAGSVKG